MFAPAILGVCLIRTLSLLCVARLLVTVMQAMAPSNMQHEHPIPVTATAVECALFSPAGLRDGATGAPGFKTVRALGERSSAAAPPAARLLIVART